MAVNLLACDVLELCLGKPALRSLSVVSATVADVISALKESEESFVSVWNCDHSSSCSESNGGVVEECRCVGKICMVDVVCYLCREENLSCPSSAVLSSPVSVILPKDSGLVRHLDPHSSLLEAINLILEGAQNLVVPIQTSSHINKPKKKLVQKSSSICSSIHSGREFCWLTQEDIVRYLLSSIGFFSPLPALSIKSLGIINTDILSVAYTDPASSAIDAIYRALIHQTSVAVIDDDGTIIGEISPVTLASCDETVAAAIAVLSAVDLMAYIDCGGPPDYILQQVKSRLWDRNLDGMLALLGELPVSSPIHSSSASSSDEESSSVLRSNARSRKFGRSRSFSARMVRNAEAIVCHPESSLVAVMMKALAYRINYVWVVEDDSSLAGIVTFAEILRVFREQTQAVPK